MSKNKNRVEAIPLQLQVTKMTRNRNFVLTLVLCVRCNPKIDRERVKDKKRDKKILENVWKNSIQKQKLLKYFFSFEKCVQNHSILIKHFFFVILKIFFKNHKISKNITKIKKKNIKKPQTRFILNQVSWKYRKDFMKNEINKAKKMRA